MCCQRKQRFHEWSSASWELQLNKLQGGAETTHCQKMQTYFMAVFHVDDSARCDAVRATMNGRILSQWWDSSSEAGPASRPESQFSAPLPSLEVVSVANGQAQSLRPEQSFVGLQSLNLIQNLYVRVASLIACQCEATRPREAEVRINPQLCVGRHGGIVWQEHRAGYCPQVQGRRSPNHSGFRWVWPNTAQAGTHIGEPRLGRRSPPQHRKSWDVLPRDPERLRDQQHAPCFFVGVLLLFFCKPHAPTPQSLLLFPLPSSAIGFGAPSTQGNCLCQLSKYHTFQFLDH